MKQQISRFERACADHRYSPRQDQRDQKSERDRNRRQRSRQGCVAGLRLDRFVHAARPRLTRTRRSIARLAGSRGTTLGIASLARYGPCLKSTDHNVNAREKI